ncbi:XRE family transcriptional regulator [Kiloniella litopenaei]|uniref:XRE family transcriptional regulator n=1 Tax=Kiloniella litopenaei TaxID=1549748 RepID=UPI000696AAFE|nr:LexA family transcriptional regulator [Kiloniella litopenaei]
MENRIKEIRTEKGMTLQQVADKAGTTKAQVMKLEKGDRRLTDVWMVRLSIAMSCDPKELLNTNRSTRQSIDTNKSDDADGTGRFDDDVSGRKPAGTTSPPPARPLAPASGCEPVAEIAVRGGMGGGGEAGVSYSDDGQGGVAIADDVKGNWFLPTEYLRSELSVSPVAARIIEVQGDSMTPTLVSGDRVMIDTNDQRPTPPGIFALWDGFGVVVKRLELIPNSDPPLLRISSDNANHKEYKRTIEEVNIIGRVVWYGRRM